MKASKTGSTNEIIRHGCHILPSHCWRHLAKHAVLFCIMSFWNCRSMRPFCHSYNNNLSSHFFAMTMPSHWSNMWSPTLICGAYSHQHATVSEMLHKFAWALMSSRNVQDMLALLFVTAIANCQKLSPRTCNNIAGRESIRSALKWRGGEREKEKKQLDFPPDSHYTPPQSHLLKQSCRQN